MRTVWGDHGRFFETYFKTYPGLYFTGDGCRRDEDGYYWITGRVDDVINVSGHRIGTAEVESSLVSHPKVAEAAVVGYPHDIKGQAIYAFVTLNAGEEGDDALRKELVQEVRNDIGALAAPEKIQFTPGAAQDPFGQDHAPHPAQDRRRRDRRVRRYVDARGSDRGRCAGGGPPMKRVAASAFCLTAAAPAYRPQFNPVDFFRGKTHGDGVLKVDLSISPRRSPSTAIGTTEKDGSLVLMQTIHGPTSRRACVIGGMRADRAEPVRRDA